MPTTAAELARAEWITAQAMGTTSGTLLAGLGACGFGRRDPDPNDGRLMIRSATEAGIEIVRHTPNAQAYELTKLLSAGFSPEELAVLVEAAPLLERLGEQL